MKNNRLAMMAEMLPVVDTLADIGTDHGGLLTALAKAGKIRRGIGVEIAQGPYRSALANVAAAGLENQIEIRLGDGFAPLAQGEAAACAIAGMGGSTIAGILEKGRGITKRLTYLLLQPMNRESLVRLFLQQDSWRICKEALVEDRGQLYSIILAEQGDPGCLSPLEAEFGPLLLAEKPPLLAFAVEQRIRRLSAIVWQLERSDSEASHIKKSRLTEQIKEWEALYNDLYLSRGLQAN
jgi:tRNA (adenine22-N1)-methyltransferase